MTPQQLGQLVVNLTRWESAVPWMYRDSAPEGNITVGIGIMLPRLAAALELPFLMTAENRKATASEISADFTRVKSMPPARAASSYRNNAIPVELPPEAIQVLAEQRLEHVFLPGLEDMFMASPGFKGWADLPWPAQQVLVDLAWNLGIGHPGHVDSRATGLWAFGNLRDAVASGAWARAIHECHVSTSRPERNQWRAQTLMDCA